MGGRRDAGKQPETVALRGDGAPRNERAPRRRGAPRDEGAPRDRLLQESGADGEGRAEGDADAQARARALSSPLRMRVLRLCAFESRTNKELAELLGVNPGTMLHHVRTLASTGFLEAQPERVGAQGAREIPYRATGLSWDTPMPGASLIMVEVFLQQIAGLAPDEVDTAWLGLKLNEEHYVELRHRLDALLQEFKDRGPDEDGDTYSLFAALHPDFNPPATPPIAPS